jgi:hypothetical protein
VIGEGLPHEPRKRLLGLACTLMIASSPCCGTTRPRTHVEPLWARAILFPVQVVPNIVCDMTVSAVGPFVYAAEGKDPGNLCGLSVIAAPIFGLVFGVIDAADGVPFWELFHPAPGEFGAVSEGDSPGK